MELFSEIYGCYYSVVGRLLTKSYKTGLTKEQIDDTIQEQAFYESALHLLPKLFSNEWALFNKKNDTYYSALHSPYHRPMTKLESAWLVALLNDRRIQLFLDEKEIIYIREHLKQVDPLFEESDFYYFDRSSDGDDFNDETYIQHFRMILQACKEKKQLQISYESGKGNPSLHQVVPWKLSYSQRDDKFRLLAGKVIYNHPLHLKALTLNLARIKNVTIIERVVPDHVNLRRLFQKTSELEPIQLKISLERNALERCMVQFASWEKQTEFCKEDNCYICQIYYDKSDETELLIRILSFGPAVQVLGPPTFLEQVRQRVRNQANLIKEAKQCQIESNHELVK